MAEFRQGWPEADYAEGRRRGNRIPVGGGRNDRVRRWREDLVRRQATVIVATGSIGYDPCGQGGDLDDSDCFR